MKIKKVIILKYMKKITYYSKSLKNSKNIEKHI